MKYAQVVIRVPLSGGPPLDKPGDATSLPTPYAWIERSFTYDIPEELRATIRVGQLVWVPFGARRLQGIVIELADETTLPATRPIAEIATTEPLLTPTQIQLARWMARRYLAPLADCVWLFLPPGIESKIETVLELATDGNTVPDDLPAKQRALLERVHERGALKTAEVPPQWRGAMEALVRRGFLRRSVHVRPPDAKPRCVPALRLAVDPETACAKIAALSNPPVSAARWQLTPAYFEQLPALSPAQARACVYLREHGNAATTAQLKAALGATTRILRTLEQAGWIARVPSLPAPTSRQARWNAIVDFLARAKDAVEISAIRAATGATAAELQKLQAAGLLVRESVESIRDPLAHRTFERVAPPVLTAEQQAVWQEIERALEARTTPAAFLVHGVTGSGKTEIYLYAIEKILQAGKQAIALVPEISLTPQTIRRFGARFGERLGVIHSQLSVGERYDTWRRIREGKIDVVIGPRSALFAPLPRLGLIVLDEEHDPSYKSDVEFAHQPAFHAREVALEMARVCGAVVILGDATPDVETYARAQRGELKRLALPNRILAHTDARETGKEVQYQPLPPVEIADMRAELMAGNRSVFSRALRAAMQTTLAHGEQVILFLNRRGTASALVCRDCGQAVKCPRCHVPYTVHQSEAGATHERARRRADGDSREALRDDVQMVCHHCGKRSPLPKKCAGCGSARLRPFGLGTEKLEQLVKDEFPQARPLRWDRDVTGRREAHEQILDAFIRGEANVLIGTQMIAKGLDLPRVTLVGVVNADTGLFLPDFRAAERTFQLLTQVAGRAGRGARGGQAIIQTFNPDHYAIRAAARHDYAEFYEHEMRFRRAAQYPPFQPLTRLLYTSPSATQAREASERLAAQLQDRIRREGVLQVELIGPAPAYYARLRGQYRQHILLKGRGAQELLATFPLPMGWRVDVDPEELL